MRVIFDKVAARWGRLPQKTRVQLIAAALLVFTGTEVFVLAPYILDIAIMIDVGGLVVVVAALRSSISVSKAQMRALIGAAAGAFMVAFRNCEVVGDFGSRLSLGWYRRYLSVDRVATRCSAALLVFAFGLLFAKSVIVYL